MISARAELTSEEIARRRQVLAELNAPPPTAAAEMTPIAKWQTDLAYRHTATNPHGNKTVPRCGQI
jgi:hypothetical protein